MQAGENWEKHKATAEDLVCSWEPKDKVCDIAACVHISGFA